MGIIKKIILYFKKRKEEKERKELYKKKLKELRKRDPFLYRNKCNDYGNMEIMGTSLR